MLEYEKTMAEMIGTSGSKTVTLHIKPPRITQ